VWDMSARQWGLEGLFNEGTRQDSAVVLFRHYPASRQWQLPRAR
jgi:hypothetical protein